MYSKIVLKDVPEGERENLWGFLDMGGGGLLIGIMKNGKHKLESKERKIKLVIHKTKTQLIVQWIK